MERTEIIKALECCIEGDCYPCAYATIGAGCRDTMCADALALIRELTEDNERLSTALAEYEYKTNIRISEEYYTAEAYDELREENERLKELNDSYAEIEQGYIVTGVKKVQADTVREFAERLKYTLCINNEENTEFFDYSYTLETIDEVANKILNNTEDEEK